jgi:peptidoglycan/LPS O-acetylase OafA/YrhL
MKYRSEIDGLRAVAVVPVILFHAGFSAFSGGFVGVDVFFVISGYLITTIILSEMEQGGFCIVRFYERRTRRILPALFLVTLISSILGWFWLMPGDMEDLSKSLAAVVTFSSNILFWRQSGYFDLDSELKPLLHTWSLAVEEQYYVIFPLFLILMWRYRKRWIFGSFMLIAAVSIIASQWGAYHAPTPTFYLLPTRGWELAIGAAIAFIFIYKESSIQMLLDNQKLCEVASLLGLLMIGYSIFAFDKNTPFPSLYALMPTIGTGLIIVFSSPRTLAGRLLSTKLLVMIGLISYSAYLFHQPLLAFVRNRSLQEPTDSVYVSVFLATLLLAYLSYRFVERPFRVKDKLSRKTVFIFAVFGSLIFFSTGIAGIITNGFKNRSIYRDLMMASYQPDNRLLQNQSWEQLKYLNDANQFGRYEVLDNAFDRTLWYKENDHRKRLIIVGNSHSKDLYNTLLNSQHAQENFQIARFGIQITQAAKATSDLFSSPNYIMSDVVMLASRYSTKDSAAMESLVKRIRRDRKLIVIVKNTYEFYHYNGRTNADVILQDLLHNGMNNTSPSILSAVERINSAYYREFTSVNKQDHITLSDSVIDEIKHKYADIIVLDRMDYICDEGAQTCYSINQNLEKYFYDHCHHSLVGSTFFGKRIDQIGWLEVLNQKYERRSVISD